MEQLINWAASNYSLIALVLLVIFGIGLLIFLYVITRLSKLHKLYKNLLRGMDGKNLEELLLTNAETLDKLIAANEWSGKRISALEALSKKCIQKIAVIRFNAFHDMGGDLSYAIALLDNNGDGVVISSIYGRDDARTYAKPVLNGSSSYQLSAEEAKAIQVALKGE